MAEIHFNSQLNCESELEALKAPRNECLWIKKFIFYPCSMRECLYVGFSTGFVHKSVYSYALNLNTACHGNKKGLKSFFKRESKKNFQLTKLQRQPF